MIRKLTLGLTTFGMLCVFYAPEAAAWGTNAQKAIAAMGMQLIEREHPNTFRVDDLNFAADAISGAAEGHAALVGQVSLANDKDTIEAIAHEIQLLRSVHHTSFGSYFSYRMGVLSALVADVVMPYGFAWDTADIALQQKINEDIEAHLNTFDFSRNQDYRIFIRDMNSYMVKRRVFFDEDKNLIHEDYTHGRSYEGFMSQAAQSYFSRCVEAVADVWHTILSKENSFGLNDASREMQTWYYVNEIKFLLDKKGDFNRARSVYKHFEAVNPNLPQAYEMIGDYFYDFSSDASIQRGVDEWQRAFDTGGANRGRVSKKLAGHFIQRGQFFMEKYASAEKDGSDLSDALLAFQRAMEFDRTSAEAADMIQQTNQEIEARNRRFDVAQQIIIRGETTLAEADKKKASQDYSNAIASYKQGISVYEAVDDEFPELYKEAKDKIRILNNQIREVITELLDSASDAYNTGDKLLDENKFEEAKNKFNSVDRILTAIPPDVTDTMKRDKEDLEAKALQKLDEVKMLQARFESANTPGAAPAPAAQ